MTGTDGVCDECDQSYVPWFTDNSLWNEVMGGSAYLDGDPGGFLCPRCFALRAEGTFPGLVWRVIPQWNGRAERMDWPIADRASESLCGRCTHPLASHLTAEENIRAGCVVCGCTSRRPADLQ